eukprot:m.523212 g.523212  ORF g.523212 m.523212 type:complete len:116 (-) comp57522_c0_seq7:695-1042(-)
MKNGWTVMESFWPPTCSADRSEPSNTPLTLLFFPLTWLIVRSKTKTEQSETTSNYVDSSGDEENKKSGGNQQRKEGETRHIWKRGSSGQPPPNRRSQSHAECRTLCHSREKPTRR